MNMTKAILLWFFTFICVQVLLGLALGDRHEQEYKDPKVSPYQLVAYKQRGKYSTDNVNMQERDQGENLQENYHVFGKKAQKGKGSYGGANVVHRRSNSKSAASVLESPFGCISTTNLCISLSLLLVLPRLIL